MTGVALWDIVGKGQLLHTVGFVPHPGGYRVLELTAGLKVISIACTPDLRDWGTLLGPLGTLMSLRLAG